MLNGDGLRVVLWVAGCTHHCKECQNPITWDINGGLEFDEAAKKEIFDELDKSYVSGITFSGGDPLHPQNRQPVFELAKEIKEKYPRKTVWLYSGFEWEEIKDLPIIPYLDVMVDGRLKLERLDTQLHGKGSSNQRVIDVPATLKSGEVVIHD